MKDFQSLETFYWVALLGGFSAAAEKLHTTQPAVSTRIARLEDSLGVKLFNRGSRHVTLTERGALFKGYVDEIFDIRTRMMHAISDSTAAFTGNFRLGVSETLVHTWLTHLLEKIGKNFPNITIDIAVDNTPEIHKQILSHDIDLGLVAAPLNHPDARSLKLCAYPFSMVASPDLEIDKNPSDHKIFGSYPIITYSRYALSSKSLEANVQEKLGIHNLRLWGIGPITSIVEMVKNCRGIGAVSPVNIQKELENGVLKILPTKIHLEDLGFYSTYIANTGSYLKEVIKELAHKCAFDYDINNIGTVDLIKKNSNCNWV